MPSKLSHFWHELKRRKVVRVITVYAAAAFVILELVSIIAEPLKLPEWFLPMVIVLLCIGFIIAIILSWIYDIQPEGGIVKTEPAIKVSEEMVPPSSSGWKIASYISFVVIVALIVLNIFGKQSGIRIDESLAKSIAVLPFHNFSTDPGQEQMCLGLTNEISGHLFRIKSFETVTPLTSVLTYIGNDKRSSEISEELGVNYILEGTYTKIGEQLRVTVKLVEPKKERQIWQHEYDQPYNEIISLQSDIALQIADHLKAFLNVSETEIINSIPTNNMEAYEKYNMAAYLFFSEGFGTIPQVIEILLEVIRLDPEYANAYAGVGMMTLYTGTVWGQKEIQYAALDALPYFEKALELDQNNALAHYGMAQINEWVRWDYIKAEKEYLKAIELESNNPFVYHFTAEFYIKMHRLESLRAMLAKAPVEVSVSGYLSTGLILLGNNMEAYSTITSIPREEQWYVSIGRYYEWLEEYDSARFYLESALQAMDPDMSIPRSQAALALAYEKTNSLQEARKIINQLIDKADSTSAGSPAYFTACYYSGIGEVDSALYWLEKAFDNRSPEMSWLKVDAAFKILKEDPRYRDLYERTGHKAYDDYMASKNK